MPSTVGFCPMWTRTLEGTPVMVDVLGLKVECEVVFVFATDWAIVQEVKQRDGHRRRHTVPFRRELTYWESIENDRGERVRIWHGNFERRMEFLDAEARVLKGGR